LVTPARAEAVVGNLRFFALGGTPALPAEPVAGPDLAADCRDLRVGFIPLFNHPDKHRFGDAAHKFGQQLNPRICSRLEPTLAAAPATIQL